MRRSTTKPANAALATATSTDTVNSRHERLETFLRGRRGVATKCLDSYLAWYHLAILPKLPTPRSVSSSVAGLIPAGPPVCVANAN